MNYSIEMRSDSPVMLVQFLEGFSAEDLKAYLAEARQAYDDAEMPIYQIMDIRQVKLGFDDIMGFLRVTFSGEKTATKHPMNKGTLIVTDNRFYQMMAKGLTNASFGGMKIQIYESLDDALNWVRDQAA